MTARDSSPGSDLEGQTAATLPLLEAGAIMIDGMTRVQKEVAQFVANRIRHDIEAQQELLNCRSIDQVRDLQVRFVKTALDQFSEEATRLLTLGSEVLTRSAGSRPE